MPLKPGIRMERTQEAERRGIPFEERGGQTEKDPGREHQAEREPDTRCGAEPPAERMREESDDSTWKHKLPSKQIAYHGVARLVHF